MGGTDSPRMPDQYYDADRPRIHVQPPAGWMNDPNAPIYYKGRYHMFYQYLPHACEWDFGIVWGHAVSPDLAHWQHLPPALVPTPGWVDADGCFSGSATLDSSGRPIILYTGVRLRSNSEAGPLPPQEHDLGMVWIESQCVAVPEDPKDELLVKWKKMEVPFLSLPPSELRLTGWRDPFYLAPLPVNDGWRREHRILIGSGIKGQGGTALMYRSDDITQGWELEGCLCTAPSDDTGVVWECPILLPLLPVPLTIRAPYPQAPPVWLNSSVRSASLKQQQQQQQQHALHHQQQQLKAGGRSPSLMQQLQQAVSDAIKINQTQSSPKKLLLSKSPVAVPFQITKESKQDEEEDEEPEFEFGPAPGLGSHNKQNGGGTGDGDSDCRPFSPEFWPESKDLSRSASHSNLNSLASPSSDLKGAQQQSNRSNPKPGVNFSTTDFGIGVESEFVVASIEELDEDDLQGGKPRVALRLDRAATFEHWTEVASESEVEDVLSSQVSRESSIPLSGDGASSVEKTSADTATDTTEEEESEESDMDGNSNQGHYAVTIGSHVGQRHRSSSITGEERTTTPYTNNLRIPSSSLEFITSIEEVQEQEESMEEASLGQAAEVDKFAAVMSGIKQLHIRKPSTASPAVSSTITIDQTQNQQEQMYIQNRIAQLSVSPSRQKGQGIGIDKDGVMVKGKKGGSLTASPNLTRVDSGVNGEGFGLSRGHSLGAPLPSPPKRPWYLFTVSPDAPANPVLYWTGHLADDGRSFELETAKGPYRLDLGDILYAPNVCQDDQGRWLLWGWLQERRKAGTYSYAGCLGLPRVLHCSDDGRLVQAPAPEVAALRQGQQFEARHVTVYPESVTPVEGVSGQRLDMECSIERGSAVAAGLLFRSHEAEAEGGTAIIYDWERNQLEAIFNVPPNWHPAAAVASRAAQQQQQEAIDVFEEEDFDPVSLFLSPRAGNRTPSATSMSLWHQGSSSSSMATSPIAPHDTDTSSPPSRGGSGINRGPFAPPLKSTIPVPTAAAVIGEGVPSPTLRRSSSSLGVSLGARGVLSGSSSSLGGLGVGGVGPPPTGGGGSFTNRLGSFSNIGMFGNIDHHQNQNLNRGGGGSLPPLSRPSSGIFHVGSLTRGGSGIWSGNAGIGIGGEDTATPTSSTTQGFENMGVVQGDGMDDVDLDTLLHDLAAPMREEPAPVQELRRVGGPLLMPHTSDRLHLRIIIDHSVVEVFTGTGEVLSTRIYRGEAPEDAPDAGIYFLAFGGAAILERVAAWELGSAWEHPVALNVQERSADGTIHSTEVSGEEFGTVVEEENNTHVLPVETAVGLGKTKTSSPSISKRTSRFVSRNMSGASSRDDSAGSSKRVSFEDERKHGSGGMDSVQSTPSMGAAARADALFDEIVMAVDTTSIASAAISSR